MIYKINQILTNRQKVSLVIMAVLLFIGGLFDLLGISIILPLLDIIMDEAAVVNEKWYILLVRIFNIENARDAVIWMIIIMIVTYVIKNVYAILMYQMVYRVTYGFKKDLSMRLLRCYMYQDYTFHLKNNVADLQRNILTDTGQFFGFISDILNIFNQIVVCLLIGGYLLLTDWRTALSVFVLLGGAIVSIYKIQKKAQIKRGIENRISGAELNKWIIQSFNGIKEIQVLGRENFFIEECEAAYDRGMNANRKSNLAALYPKPIMEMVCVSGLLLIILVRLLSGAELNQFISILSVFAMAAFRLLPCFNSISAYLSSMFFEKDAVDAVYQDISEMESLEKNIEHNIESLELKFTHEIKIKNLTYRYPKTDKDILSDVSFALYKNQSVGIIGASGAGKSTLIDIILGVLPVTHGRIEVDGKNISDHMSSWHHTVGYIPQSIYLMDDTIRHNVAFGVHEDDISDERIWEVLREAQIDEFVRNLPEGLDASIGDRGVRISGGQRQRLGIARALYHDPQVLVFDEATSALDNDTEAALMEAINGFKGKRTMLIIAHRLHTIENCDVVFEVKDGKVIERKDFLQ